MREKCAIMHFYFSMPLRKVLTKFILNTKVNLSDHHMGAIALISLCTDLEHLLRVFIFFPLKYYTSHEVGIVMLQKK